MTTLDRPTGAATEAPTTGIGTPRWRGQWITPDPQPEPDLLASMDLSRPPAGVHFSRSLFRRTLELGGVPDSAPVRLTANSRYVLWVNGTEVGRGPARSQPLRQRYDTYDLAPFLEEGRNVIGVLVTYYGEAMSFWQPPPAGALADAMLVLEGQVGDTELVTDGLWRVERSPAWTLAPRDGITGVPVELVDARLLPRAWHSADFDDSDWPQASVVAATHIGALAQTRPPSYPFGRLQPRGISHLVGEEVGPAQVLDISSRACSPWSDSHPVARVTQALLSTPATLDTPALPAHFTVGPGRVQHLAVDFGRIVAGFVELDVDAPAGTVVELHYREKPFRPEFAGQGLEPATGARYVCAGDGDTFSGLELNGLRYLHLVVHAAEEATATVSRIAVREHLYPRRGNAYFDCDDDLLNTLYRAGVRTVQLNSLDAYVDCPTREQRAWVGDGVVHQQVDLVTNEDWGLARNYLELGDSPRADGILPMVVAGEFEATNGFTIPDWSLSWVHGVALQYRYDGDLTRAHRHLPTIERILRWYGDYVDDHGTIADVPEWNLVDWSSIFLAGRSSILTGMWGRALAEYADLCDAVGHRQSAEWARRLHRAAAKGYEDFWDEGRGVYVDHIVDGDQRPAASQAANAVAIISGLAPAGRHDRIVTAMTDPERLVVRSWIGNYETGGYDLQKMLEQIRGLQRIDWDVDREMVLAEPFFSYAVHDAVAQAGRADLLVDLLPRWESLLAGGYDTFAECWGWGTPVHGWSSTPARDLVAYVLGITPDEPGYQRVRVAPRLGRLARAAGSVPTPHGDVEVRVDEGIAIIDSPVPIVVVAEDLHETHLPAGSHRVTIREARLS
jgi:hypothetical protein